MSGSEESDGDFDPREFLVAAEDDPEALRNAARQKNANVNNLAGLKSKLTDLMLPANWGWVETLLLSTQTPLELENPDDDLAREAEFYQRSLLAVKQGVLQFDQSKLPWRVPSDFYAERVKPDSQMQKIKDSLMAESRRMNIVAERKKVKAIKKNAKSLRATQAEDRAKAKKAFTSGVNALIKKGGGHNEIKVPRSEHVDIESAVNGLIEGRGFRDDNSNKRKREEKDEQPKKSKRRLAMDKKYGHGGPKGAKKKNSFESSADMSGWSTKKNRSLPTGVKMTRKERRAGAGGGRGRGRGRGGGRGRGQRPGKGSRDASRGRK